MSLDIGSALLFQKDPDQERKTKTGHNRTGFSFMNFFWFCLHAIGPIFRVFYSALLYLRPLIHWMLGSNCCSIALTVCLFDDLTMHSFISKQYMEKHEKMHPMQEFTVINFDHSFGNRPFLKNHLYGDFNA
jgi:hypothetical protein